MSARPSNAAMTIDIAVISKSWDALPYARQISWWHEKYLALAALADIRLGELSIALVDDEHMAEYNKTYRQKDGPTNVLSFPTDAPLLGDIVLSHSTIAREALSKGASFEDHLAHLAIHGFLHLQGYDHDTRAQARQMEALEIKALAALGIDNPYEIRKSK